MRRWLLASSTLATVLIVWMLDTGPSAAEEKKRRLADTAGIARPGAPQPSEKAQGKRSPLTVYVPPSNRGAPRARTAGGTRGANAPRIAVLAPDHVGLTTREQPILAWFLSEDTDAPVELTWIADGAVEPLAVTRLRGPLRAGIHLVDLEELAARLEEGKTYDWFVTLVVDPLARDTNVVAGGRIERLAATPELAKELSGGEPSYRVLARHGIWYDAIADLSSSIVAAPASTLTGSELRAERAALLEQVGVSEVAVFEEGAML